MVCVPVAGPWVVVPAATACPRRTRRVAAHLPARLHRRRARCRLSDRAIDVGFIGTIGSPVNPGITTSRSVVFLGDLRRAAGARAELPAVHRLHAGSGGGGSRVPPRSRSSSPGRPVTRRVRTVRVRPGTTTVDAALHRGRAPRRRNACVRRSRRARRRVQASSGASRARSGSSGAERCRPRERRCRARRRPRGRPGPGSLLEGVMSFQSPWMLLGLLVSRRSSACGSGRSGAAQRYAVQVHEPRRARDGRLRPLLASLRAAGAPRARARTLVVGSRATTRRAHAPAREGDGDPRRRHVALDAGRRTSSRRVSAQHRRRSTTSSTRRRTTSASGLSCSPEKRRWRRRRPTTTSSSRPRSPTSTSSSCSVGPRSATPCKRPCCSGAR